MAKFCLSCGEALGTRQLLHDAATCERCREDARRTTPTRGPGSGLLELVEELETRNPLRATGRLGTAGSGQAD